MRLIPAMWTASVVGSITLLAIMGSSATAARGSAQMESARCRAIRDLAEQISAARASVPSFADRPRPNTTLAAAVGAALEAAGLPAESLSGLSPDVAAGGGDEKHGLRHRRASVTLGPVTLRQLGLFLGAWREAQPAWTVTGIDVGLLRTQGGAAPGEDLPLHALVRLEALYAEDQGGASR